MKIPLGGIPLLIFSITFAIAIVFVAVHKIYETYKIKSKRKK
jgi:hypothetical protein